MPEVQAPAHAGYDGPVSRKVAFSDALFETLSRRAQAEGTSVQAMVERWCGQEGTSASQVKALQEELERTQRELSKAREREGGYSQRIATLEKTVALLRQKGSVDEGRAPIDRGGDFNPGAW